MRGFALALRFMTRLPLRGGHEPSDAELAASVAWYPAVGGVVGAILALVALVGQRSPAQPVVLAAVLALLAPALTGGLHEDGLGDAADGLGGGWTRERSLEIMRDSRVGSYGAIAISGALLLRFAALLGITPAAWPAALLAAHGLSRLSPVLLIRALPYARGDAEGLAQPMIGGVGDRHVAFAVLTAAALALPAGPAPALAALGLVIGLTALLGAGFRRKVGGVTGDLAGAAVVACELAVLLWMAMVWPSA